MMKLALFFSDFAKTVRHPDPKFKVSLHTEDSLICPLDPQLSVFIAKTLQEKGVSLFVGQKLFSIDEPSNEVTLRNKDGSESILDFDNLIIEPQVKPDALVQQAGKLNAESLLTESGAFSIGNSLKPLYPVLNNRELDLQAAAVAGRLLGQLPKYEYSPEATIRTGVNSSTTFTFDHHGKVRFRQEYSGLNFKGHNLSNSLKRTVDSLRQEFWD